MAEVFETKVRSVGTSLGVLIPMEIARKEKLKEGQKIEISILKKNLKLLKEAFGIDKGASKFEREHNDREF